MKLYPGGSITSPEWLEIRRRIAARARWRCEECNVRNHAWGWRDKWGRFHYVRKGALIEAGYPLRTPFELLVGCYLVKIIEVVCTVAHKDGELVDHSDANLAFWCQRCHNRHDVSQRKAERRRTRTAGQRDLFVSVTSH